jgi:putative tricarboxylic transport membrane protein
METLGWIGHGFMVALAPQNLLFCFIGVLMGTLIGVLPGIGPVSGVAILLPIVFTLEPTAAMIMLAGIYYGSMYGGSTTSILINTPGESASVMTCLDGYAMARAGRAGVALGMSALASFVAGTVSVVGLMLLAPPLAEFALRFGPAEYFALMVLGLTMLTRLAGKSLIKGLMMGMFGLALGTIGLDPMTGVQRYTAGRIEFLEGVGFVSVAMGLFALGEIFSNAEESLNREVFKTDLKGLWPTTQDWIAVRWTLVRATIIGFFVGALPGAGATVASFMAYVAEKKASKHPEKFGTGVIEGVAAPEAANNAATGGALVPLLTLGIPSSATTAILLGALLILNLRPGPLMIVERPEFFWAVVTSMYVGNVMLLILNLPLVGVWASLLRIPYTILLPLILLFTLIGAFAINNNPWDIWIMILFGVIGYLMRKFEYPAAPVVLALVLGPMMETNFRRTLAISQGDYTVFLTHPISAFLIICAVLSLAWPLIARLFTGGKQEVQMPLAEEV